MKYFQLKMFSVYLRKSYEYGQPKSKGGYMNWYPESKSKKSYPVLLTAKELKDASDRAISIRSNRSKLSAGRYWIALAGERFGLKYALTPSQFRRFRKLRKSRERKSTHIVGIPTRRG